MNIEKRLDTLIEKMDKLTAIGDKLSFYASCQAGLGDKSKGGLALLGRGDLTIPKS